MLNIGTYSDSIGATLQYMSLISGNECTTISCAIPIIMELQMHLDDMEKEHGLSKLSTAFRSELNRRFIPYLDPADSSYEPI